MPPTTDSQKAPKRSRVLLSDSDEEEKEPSPLEGLGTELLEHTLSFLTHREAASARKACTALRDASKNLEKGVGGVRHRYRLIVACSASSRLVELDVSGGGSSGVQRMEPARAWVTTRKPQKPAGAWLTAVKLHQGSVYACQYQKKGVLQFDGDSLRYKRIVASNNRTLAPEGLTFTRGHMFVTSADGGRVLMYDAAGREVAVVTPE